MERLAVSTRNGAHLDAPYHHHSTLNRGERARTIHEAPLDGRRRPGVKPDFRGLEDPYLCTPADVEAELARIGPELRPRDLVVVATSAGAADGRDDHVSKGCGMGREATLWLLERGVRVTGPDAGSRDALIVHAARKRAETHDPAIIWQGRRASMEIGYGHLEKLANIDQRPPSGFEIICFPFKIRKASAGFIRAVAVFEGAQTG